MAMMMKMLHQIKQGRNKSCTDGVSRPYLNFSHDLRVCIDRKGGQRGERGETRVTKRRKNIPSTTPYVFFVSSA